jgi:shikimate dehydrogenase
MTKTHAERERILLGLIGDGIQKSRSPHLYEAECDAQGLRALYSLIDLHVLGLGADALPELLRSAELMGFRGLNITHPCKQAVISFLDELSPSAQAIGAVNTVVFESGKRIGHNTDSTGFAEAFRQTLPDAPRRRVIQLGGGGGGSAVAWALLSEGVDELILHDVDAKRTDALCARLNQIFGSSRARPCGDIKAEMQRVDGVINCTPIGMDAHPGTPLPLALVTTKHWVGDIIYFPLETKLLEHARKIGCRTIDGTGMVVFQAAAAFRLFTRREPEVARMSASFASTP